VSKLLLDFGGESLSRNVRLRRKLNTFDVIGLVVGSIIGADIYVAAAIGARLVGPASLLVWVAAGIVAIIIALSFSHCAAIMPRVGGPYAYVKEVSGRFHAFMVGWGLFLAEWLSLAVFPVAFATYASAIAPELGWGSGIPLKVAFIVIVFATNAFGIKAAGKFNDVLTIAKLGPLVLVVFGGLVLIGLRSGTALSNLTPFSKGTLQDLGQAFVLIFWAYAGFELSTLPSDEIEQPQKTIPRAMVIGMLIVAVFYLATNFVVVGVVDQTTLAHSNSPLLDTGSSIFGSIPGLSGAAFVIVGVGALVSILGADESGTLGTSRLAYAMSVDGLFPGSFSRLAKKSSTPLIGLAIICSTALVASILGGLTELIAASVFLLAFAYLSTSVSALLLAKKYPEKSSKLAGRRAIPVAGIVFSAILMVLVDPQLILVSVGLLSLGIPIYALFSPKKELHDLREAFLSHDAILRRAYEQGDRFLAHPWRHLVWLVYRRRNEERPFIVSNSTDPPPKR
jgi:APA family basic amino acid/polyamine antiporter